MKKSKFKWKDSFYWLIFQQNRLLLVFTVIFSIIAAATGVFIAIFLQKVIDIAILGDMEGFKKIIIIMLLYLIIFGIVNYIYSLLSKKLLRNVTKKLRQSIFKGVFRRNYQDFNGVNTADYISVLTNDIKLIEENYILPLFTIIEYLVSFFVTLILLLKLSLLVTLLLFVGMLFMFLIPSAIGQRLQSKQEILSNQYSIFTTKIKDLFSGFEVIKSFHLLSRVSEDFEKQNNELASKKYKADRLFILNNSASQFLAVCNQLITVFVAAYLVMQGKITMGTLLAIIQLSGSFVMPLVIIMQNFPKLQGVAPIMKRVEEFGAYEDTSFRGTKQPEFHSSIKISDLAFSYHEDHPVLAEVSLEIEKGKKYAIVGESGCGKTTLMKVALGYYANYTGKIIYDHINLRDSEVVKLSEIASIIHQNVYMFDKTIRDNICLYSEYPEDILEKALALSGVDKFMEEMEERLDTMVGENGANLSGGQRQRIAIARALMKGTPLLILDEGTSAIDMQTSNDIERNLIHKDDLTLVTITHKLNEDLLRLYDQIIYMEHGRIIEKGNYQDLYSEKGRFYQFCN